MEDKFRLCSEKMGKMKRKALKKTTCVKGCDQTGDLDYAAFNDDTYFNTSVDRYNNVGPIITEVYDKKM